MNSSEGCFGHYNFDRIASHARKRFIQGVSTIRLLQQAQSQKEREEIALVCMLDLEDEFVLDIQLDCRYADRCKVTNCRDRLRKLIEKEALNNKQANQPKK